MSTWTPIGYRIVNGRIEIHKEYAGIVPQIFHDYDEGESANRIAIKLKDTIVLRAQKLVTWTHAYIGKILENVIYTGEGGYPQIIEQDLFDRVQERRQRFRRENSRGEYRQGENERKFFNGMLVCAECGMECVHIADRYVRQHVKEPGWMCRNAVYNREKACRRVSVSSAQVENACIRAINQMIEAPETIKAYKEQTPQISPMMRKIERRIEEAQDISAESMKELLFQRAAERYKMLTIRDEKIQTDRMQAALAGRKSLDKLEGGLHRELIKMIVVNKDGGMKIVFQNHSSLTKSAFTK